MSVYSYPKVLIDIQNYIDRQGNLTVRDILDGYTVRLNYKWLERNFKKHLGISPQSYLLIRRFLNAYMDLDSLTSKDLLQIAIDNGYYDDKQRHVRTVQIRCNGFRPSSESRFCEFFRYRLNIGSESAAPLASAI